MGAPRCSFAALPPAVPPSPTWVLPTAGNIQQSVAHYKQAIVLDPHFADAHSNLGNVYKDSGHLAEARACYEQALALNPEQAVVWGNLAAVHLELGDIDRSLELFDRALAMEPNFPDALSNRGNALKFAGRLSDSIESYRRALELQPTHTDALNNLANTYKDAGDAVTAERMYRKAISLRPDFAGAHSNLGNLLKEQHRLQEALEEYDAALAADPSFSDAWSNRGNALKDLGRFSDAAEAYKQAIAIRPDFADALGNLASVYKDTAKLDKAIEFYRRSLRLRQRSTDPIAYCNLVHCLQTVCDWRQRGAIFRKTKQLVAQQMVKGQVPSVQPHHALVYPLTGTEQLELAVHYARSALRHVRVLGLEPHQWTPATVRERLQSLEALEQECGLCPSVSGAPGGGASATPGVKPRRLRVGYVSSDLGNHPLAHLMNNVFVWHDRRRFEVFAYATSAGDGSKWRAKIQAGVEHFVEAAGLAHDELADRIRRDEIDILVNLNGYTKGSRTEVFALRPAPVQAMYLGFPGSSGAHYMQYFVSDRIASPPRLAHLYSEKLAYMPHCYFVNDHMQSFLDAGKPLEPHEVDAVRATYELPPRDKGVVLAMFNQLYKIDPTVFDTWCAVLKALPNAVLWLLQFPAAGEANIRAAAARAGVPPAQLVFSPVAPKAEHISRGRCADLFLDTPLCNAHTTGTDILWGGVPIITLPLESLASRVGASLLGAVGHPELIAVDLQDYKAKIIQYASDLPRLRALQAKLSASRSTTPLFDTRRWVAHWQLLLLGMCRDYRKFAETCAAQGVSLDHHLRSSGVHFSGLPDTGSGGAGGTSASQLAAAAAAMTGQASAGVERPSSGPFASVPTDGLGDGPHAPGVSDAGGAADGGWGGGPPGGEAESHVEEDGMYACLVGRRAASHRPLLRSTGEVDAEAVCALTVSHQAGSELAAQAGPRSAQASTFGVASVPGPPVCTPVITAAMTVPDPTSLPPCVALGADMEPGAAASMTTPA